MNESNVRCQYIVEVQNFGPISHGSIELRPLTVFVGPSNTGKSYMAVLIYALHKFFERLVNWVPGLLDTTNSSTRYASLTPTEIVASIVEDVRLAYEKDSIFASKQIELSDEVICALTELINNSGFLLDREISRCFGCELEELNRVSSSQEAQVLVKRVRENSSDVEVIIDYSFGGSLLPEGSRPFTEILTENDSRDLHRVCVQHLSGSNQPFEMRGGLFRFALMGSVFGIIFKAIFHDMVQSLNSVAYYLPADRTAVMHAHPVVLSSVLQQSTESGLLSFSNKRRITGFQTDFLRTLNESDVSENNSSKIQKEMELSDAQRHARQIEDEVLNGSILCVRDTREPYPEFKYVPKGWKNSLSLIRASSMVAELAPVVIYLRSCIRSDNLIIIEEPESHVHPAAQVELFRILFSMVKQGYRVLLTTHSEWLMEKLSNVVARSQIPTNTELETGADNSSSLSETEVGTWLFVNDESKKESSGSVIKEVNHDKDNGLYSVGYDEVSQALYNDWVDIDAKIDQQT